MTAPFNSVLSRLPQVRPAWTSALRKRDQNNYSSLAYSALMTIALSSAAAFSQPNTAQVPETGASLASDSAPTSAEDSANSTDTETTPEKDQKGFLDKVLNAIGADGKFDADKGVNFSFLPGPFYNPDTEFGIGLSTVGLYKVDPKDNVSQLSSLTISSFVSTNKSLGVVIDNRMFLEEDQYRFYINAGIVDAPEVYYGIGYDENNNDANEQRYVQRQYSLTPRWLTRVLPETYFGAGLTFSFTNARHIRPENPTTNAVTDFPSRNISAGLLVEFVHDNRDFQLNPSKGKLLQFTLKYYSEPLGSDTNFVNYVFDYREYFDLGDAPGLLALQVKADLTEGSVPWSLLPKIGGGQGLRGYIIGRYRDRQTLLSQIEYRVPLGGRHGLVTWAGGAALANRVSEFHVDEILPNIGIGYRLALKERVNLRLDLGFGRNGSGFYFNVNEAF
ncbi:Uncharacterised protein [BD1-7 clade bacterium]|uniref:Bacterial surface antigen (D15) domain-containing protein n=1 Tax=BD1-7 clade bacterium TaxID=2029982 RepID=A0A5S9Q2E8_9GAMM|nr:Uncharacterised protein [BD1-7 clade bacterium]CAA0112333.1 Uncharacterised protein [BD1-7 clade bacterium]